MEGWKEGGKEGRKEGGKRGTKGGSLRRQKKIRRKKGRTEYISKNRYVVYKDKN